MKKVAFHNLGCKVNSYEIEFLQQRFTENDFLIVPFDQKADIYVVNTCTVTNIADRKSRQMLHRAKANNKDSIVVAMGCYVQTNLDKAREDDGIDIIIGNTDKGRAYEIIMDYLSNNEVSNNGTSNCDSKKADGVSKNTANNNNQIETADDISKAAANNNSKLEIAGDISKTTVYDEYTLTATTEHTRVYIKIQDGCNQFCSYCAIPLARGRVRSRSIDNTVNEIKGLVANGYKEFVLTGIHLSSYKGENGELLIDVIEAVDKIEGVERIRLGSLEPRIITRDFLDRLVKVKSICPHFHLSLQSGSDTVLKRMNRHYTTDEFYEGVCLIREYFEHPAITTDVIVGFPGETEEEFICTRDYLNKVDFYEAHVFKYSRRQGTVADRLPNQHTEKTKSARSEILINDDDLRSKAFREYYIGKQVDFIVEEPVEIEGKRYMTGYTREYVRVVADISEDLVGQIYSGTISGMLTDEILVI